MDRIFFSLIKEFAREYRFSGNQNVVMFKQAETAAWCRIARHQLGGLLLLSGTQVMKEPGNRSINPTFKVTT
jgi:hypothetical protein